MIYGKDIKKHGIKAIEEDLKQHDRSSISVNGKVRYVVVTVEDYEQLRIAELELNYIAVMKDIENGNFVIETAEEHLRRLKFKN